MPAGRPTKYSEAYCNEVIDCMGRGFSLTAFAGEIGVSRECIYEWARVHPEFSDAVNVARAKRLLYLEGRLLDGETGPRVTSHIFALKNACPEEWRDKIQVGGDQDNPIRHAIEVNFVGEDPGSDT